MTQETRKIFGIFTLAFSIAFFALGMYFPILSTHTKVVFKFGYEEINIFDSIKMFFADREYFLAAVILVFTFIMPLAKYVELIIRILRNTSSKTLQNLDKWNMLDVFLVALLLLNFKMQSKVMVMELKVGTTFIALAVMFRILAVTFITNENNTINYHNEY
jgi:uncharacterized paraquat-inducible protein A